MHNHLQKRLFEGINGEEKRITAEFAIFWFYETLVSVSSAFRIVRHVFLGQQVKPYWQDIVTRCFSGLIFFMWQNGTFLKISALSKLMLQCHIDNMVTEKIESPFTDITACINPCQSNWLACTRLSGFIHAVKQRVWTLNFLSYHIINVAL